MSTETPMEVEPSFPPSWFEFLLDKGMLERHLKSSPNPDPSAITLLTQFTLNLEKSAAESQAHQNNVASPDTTEEELILSYRQKKTKTLRSISLQTAAFLSWDLDEIAKLHVATQHAFLKQLRVVATDQDGEDESSSLSKEFLRVLFHRWALKTFQSHSHNSFVKITRYSQQTDQIQAFESVWKELNEEESVSYMRTALEKLQEKKGVKCFLVPNWNTFSNVEGEPDWSKGEEMDKSLFESMINLELGIFLLFKGNPKESVKHFQLQKVPVQDPKFPYLRISQSKLNGYLRAVGLLKTFDQGLEDSKVIPKSLDRGKVVEVALGLRTKGVTPKLKKLLGLEKDDDVEKDDGTEKMKVEEKDGEEGVYIMPGDDKLSLFSLEKRLIETVNPKEIEECITKLHSVASEQGGTQRSLATLFSGWELPIPVQHAVKSLGPPLQDYIHILVAKSRQLLTCKEYAEARKMLNTAKSKLQQKYQQSYSSAAMNPFTMNLDRLIVMMGWETLLLDINQFISEYPNGVEDLESLNSRCRECLERLHDPTSEVNPRSEIVENILLAFINLGEYNYVANFDKMQIQRWPFVEFISLLARVCSDLFLERKETSSNYRELWSAVLPIFSNGSSNSSSGAGGKKQNVSASNKSSILTSRSSLAWILERTCSHPLISVWVSLLARLHNHILDDIGLQIHADFLHIWPNILDDITATSGPSSSELKGSRVSGSSKLNSKQIRDFLFSLLERATKLVPNAGEAGSWLRCLGDVHLAAGSPSLAMKCYVEYLAMGTDFFEKTNAPQFWNDSRLFKRMIKCCEILGCFTQAVVLCQLLTPDIDYSLAFGMAQEKTTNDASDSLYGFIWDLTILEFLINLHTKRNEMGKRQQAIKVMGLLELNSNNNEEIQREAMSLRRSQFMRTLAKHYIFV